MAEPNALYPNVIAARCQASPRLIPRSFPCSLDFHSLIDELRDDPYSKSSSAQSPLRGRTLRRIPAQSRLVSRMTKRRYTDLDSPDRDPPDCAGTRSLFSYGTALTPVEYDPSLLEPLPFDRFRSSLSEELYRASTFDSSIDVQKCGGHRDTFALLDLHHLRHLCLDLPPTFFTQITQYLDFDSYKAARLTCHSWSVGISYSRPVKFPPFMTLLTEILEKIYIELSPIDFNAARHTCRAWMITSLDERLLTLMLGRGGWSRAVLADREAMIERLRARGKSVNENDWFLSKRLATECSLGPGWSGHGICNAQIARTGLRITSEIDFSQLGTVSSPAIEDQSMEMAHFTVSNCSRFLMAFKSCTIYIYGLRGFYSDSSIQPYGGYLEALTSIKCPDRVLSVSMDTSSQQYAVAALIHGSIGIVCDLNTVGVSARWPPLATTRSRNLAYDEGQGSVFTPALAHESLGINNSLCTFATIYSAPHHWHQAQAFDENTLLEFQGARRISNVWTQSNDSQQPLPSYTGSRSRTSSSNGAEIASRAIYRNLCSIDDPPSSVAICPQRRCVAFGCRSGIELHWMDALTGQDLNRWFPLSAPSDFLYFMPGRDGVDSTRKLRLISSAAHPNAVEDALQSCQKCDNIAGNMGQAGLNDSFNHSRSLGLGTCPEHYQAIPLSDGYHVLFTLPGSRDLCLGKENPPASHIRKLTRRFVFLGPRNEHGTSILPSVYAAATELRWGVRVVAAYRDQLWFFVVPSDFFIDHDSPRKEAEASSANEPIILATIPIEGVKLATIPSIKSLALDGSAGDVTIWAFSATTKTTIFQLAGSGSKAVTQRSALSDSIIILTRDADGDTVMADAPFLIDDADLRSEDKTLSHKGMPCSPVPCFPSCIHNYCNQLLNGVCSTVMTDTDGSPTNQGVAFNATTVHHDSGSCLIPCFPACNHRYCKLLLYAGESALVTNSITSANLASSITGADTATSDPSISDAPLFDAVSPLPFVQSLEDEGYASGGDEEFEQTGGHFAIYAPPLSSRWSQEDDMERVPEYLSKNGLGVHDEGLGLDLCELCRCECEILGS